MQRGDGGFSGVDAATRELDIGAFAELTGQQQQAVTRQKRIDTGALPVLDARAGRLAKASDHVLSLFLLALTAYIAPVCQ